MLSKVNSARKSAGKAPVESYWDLRDDARRHAQKMAKEQRIFDKSGLGGVTSGWKSLAQVNGVGPDTASLFDLFMNSYRSVILGSYNYVGIGSVKDDNGILWVSMIFMNHPDDDLNDGGSSGTTTTTTTTKPPSNTTTSTTTTDPPASGGGGGSGGNGSGGEASDPPPTTDPPAPGGSSLTEPTSTIGTAPPEDEAASAAPATTTTVAAIAARPARLAPADAPQAAPVPAVEEGAGISATLVIGGFAALGLIGFAWLATTNRGVSGIGATSAPIAFEPCTGCGLVFNRARTKSCPRCRTAVA